MPMFGYILSLKGIEHKVAPATSGHHITLRYLLYVNINCPLPMEDLALGSFLLTMPEQAL